MLVPQAFNVTRHSEKPCPLPKLNHGDDDENLRVAIRQEGGEGGGDEGGGDEGGADAGDVGGDVGGIDDGGEGIGDDGGIGDGSGGGGGGENGGDNGSEISTSSEGGSNPAVISGGGGGAPAIIPDGALFAGRIAGGGTRAQIYGNRLVQANNYLPNLTLRCRAVNTEADIQT